MGFEVMAVAASTLGSVESATASTVSTIGSTDFGFGSAAGVGALPPKTKLLTAAFSLVGLRVFLAVMMGIKS
jgi:hypothetical protein